MTHEQQTDTEDKIRAATRQLLYGPVPEGLKCDVKSLCTLAGVPRATLYRAYPHLKADFDRQRATAREAGQQPDPRLAQIQRLNAEIAKLRERLNRRNTEIDTLKKFRTEALSRLTIQHDEVVRLRQNPQTTPAFRLI